MYFNIYKYKEHTYNGDHSKFTLNFANSFSPMRDNGINRKVK